MALKTFNEACHQIIKGVERTLSKISQSQVEEMVDMMLWAKYRRILIIGVGRSGLIGRAFAMRLMHLDFDVYVMGETITPAIGKGDLIIVISGSGTTKLAVTAAEIGKEVGAKIIAVTSHPKSDLGKLADHVVQIRGRTKVAKERDYFLRQLTGVHEPLAPLGTIFELSAMIFFDSLVAELIHRLGKSEGELKKKHATIE
ncbi:6-phospho-3-hexuloisomerase [Candidatus Bathyarchaeota archaeon]|nr:6-phospho-3-hexuloisomerase [Candidatus Bathyarchaeota archaeon]MBS7629326.1 6-phospho-3-hexuloisomerase [Candidatus Bathyarchaeota archaeon]